LAQEALAELIALILAYLIIAIAVIFLNLYVATIGMTVRRARIVMEKTLLAKPA
jgi:hypothetical protein